MFEYTVVHAFSLPKGPAGVARSFLVGEKIADADLIERVMNSKAVRNVVRHNVTTPEPVEPTPEPVAESAPDKTSARKPEMIRPPALPVE